jgi:glycine cleavage system H protein
MTPNDRKYTETHEWVKVVAGVAVVGITDHAQEALGDLTFIELPKVGKKVEKGKECAVVESVKAASDIYAPVSGEISEANKSIESTPEEINVSPYDAGWLFKIKGFRQAEVDALLDAVQYEKFLEDNE